ncbi:MAG: hypothetical protein HYV16_14630 [Gammaproteobacteria bacterium]|nr:hypothetical protein [Gammaproteobacteria bacterium]
MNEAWRRYGMAMGWLLAAWLLAAPAVAEPAPESAPAPELVPSVRWYAADFPPAFILKGELRGRGYYDRFYAQYILGELAGFEHRQLSASPARILRDLNVVPEACALGLGKTAERERRYRYSAPLLTYLPLGLVLRRAELPGLQAFLDAEGRVRLEPLLEQSSRRIGLAKSRALGSLDVILGRHEAQLVPIASLSASPIVLRMLALNRGIDAALAYSFELTLLNEPGPGGKPLREDLIWLPIAEEPDLQTGHVACARSPRGEAVIAAVDALLARPGVAKAMQAYYEEWLDETGRHWFALARRPAEQRLAEPARAAATGKSAGLSRP